MTTSQTETTMKVIRIIATILLLSSTLLFINSVRTYQPMMAVINLTAVIANLITIFISTDL